MAIQVRRNGAWVDNTQEKKRVNGSWVSNSPYKVMKPTISGVPPLAFKSDGENLRDWSISGQTVQASTPTPSSPVAVEGVGENTGNLFDGSQIQNDQSAETGVRKWLPVQLKPNTEYTLSTNCPRYSLGALIFVRDSSSYTASTNVNGAWDGNPRSWTTGADGILYIGYRGNGSGYDLTSFWYMLNAGSTALPFEPYGVKIPITCGGQTTNIYLASATSTRRIKKLVLTGEEDYTWYKSATRNYSWYVHPATIGIIAYTPVLCSHGETVTSVSDYSYGKVYCDNTCNLGIFDSSINTLTKLNNYFAQQYANGTPVTIWYVLATPETAAVNEPLMKIGSYADELTKTGTSVNIPTVSGSNTLSVNTTVQPSGMTIQSISQWV